MSAVMDSRDLAALRAGFDPDPEKSYSLLTRAYCEARYLHAEQSEVFWRSWQFLCHGGQLRETGSYVTASIQGRSIFATRDSRGNLGAFYNVCQHRGHELLKGAGKTRLLVCPYHAWSYALDGSLTAAPGSQNLQCFRKEDYRLKPIRIEELCGLVFVNLDPTAVPLAQTSGELAAEIGRYAPDLARLTFAHRLTYTVQANWKTCVDNFLECRHCPVAHKDFCSLVEMDTYTVTTHGIYSSHMAKAGRSTNTAYGVQAATVTDHAVWYLWPNTALMRYPGAGNFMVWKFIPTGPDTTYEEFDFFFESAAPTASERAAIDYIDKVLQVEDIGLVESVQRGMRSTGFERGRYLIDRERSGLSEHAVHHFHGLLLDAYARAVASGS